MSFVQNKHKNPSLMNNKEDKNGSDACEEQDEFSPEKFEKNALERKSVEDLLCGSSHDAIGTSISQTLSFTSGAVLQSSPIPLRRSPSPSASPSSSPKPNSNVKRDHSKGDQHLSVSYGADKNELNEDSISKSSDSSNITTNNDGKTIQIETIERPKSVSKVSERAKKKSWYSVLYPSYKSRSEDFKKLFKGVPDDERLVVDYSCAVQRDILVHGRLYVSQNYLCFYANIFRWETNLSIRWKDVTAITKEKTARVIPNAILVCTTNEKYFITSFTSRDKAYLMLFRVWQNALMDKPMQPQEMWQWVHNCYGDELGLTSDDEDYIDPYEIKDDESNQLINSKSADSVSEDHSEPQPEIAIPTLLTKKQQKIELKQREALAKQESKLLKQESKLNHRKSILKTIRKQPRDESVLPASEQLPTDMSDSSDSENGQNIPFVSTAECNSMHEGRQLVHTILPINVDTLLSLLFSKSKFLVDFHNIRKTTNMIIHRDWELNEDGLKGRTVNLTVALTQAVGPKCAHVTESQVMRECSEPGQLYSIDITSTNTGIPYADSFYVFMHYCLVRTVDDHTMFSVHAQVKYKKSVWGVVKGFIEKNTWAGLEDFYTALLRALQSEYCIPPAKAKSRRPRRGIKPEQRPPEELVQTKAIQAPFASRSVPLVISSPNEPKIKYESMTWFVLILLISLILLNVILFFKLWTLDDPNSPHNERYPDFTMLKNPPKSQEDWIKLLRQQEALHATETVKWQKILHSAIELLRKTEHTLANLMQLIDVPIRSSNDAKENTIPVNLETSSGAFMKEL